MRKSSVDKVYRGPVRRRKRLIGAPTNTPVPISVYAARTVANTGSVARYAPSTAKALKKYSNI